VVNIVTLTSATGNNMAVTDRVLKCHGHAGVALNVSDVSACGAVSRAAALRIPTLIYEPPSAAGVEREQRRDLQRRYHDHLTEILRRWEGWNGAIDLIVLAYHRFIEGEFLAHYAGRIINQHPGDLTVRARDGRRALIGMNAVRRAHDLGLDHTRTCTILVDDRLDGGPIVARGPIVPFADAQHADLTSYLRDHEDRQKKESDAPALTWVLNGILTGSLQFDELRGAPWPHLRGIPLSADGHAIEIVACR
jgi:folate-dependent phosphoribosylglycinamide formyltransferase PurN